MKTKLGEVEKHYGGEESISFKAMASSNCMIATSDDGGITISDEEVFTGYGDGTVTLDRGQVQSLIHHLQSWLDTGSLDFEEAK